MLELEASFVRRIAKSTVRFRRMGAPGFLAKKGGRQALRGAVMAGIFEPCNLGESRHPGHNPRGALFGRFAGLNG
jgi:hypothetical protein